MDKNITKSFVNTPLTLLLIILIILIIYCVMKYKLYSLQSINFDETPNTKDTKINENIIILKNIIENSKTKLKEDFVDQSSFSNDLENLRQLSASINSLNSSNLQEIKSIIENTNNQRIANKNIFLKLLSEVYTLKFIETINKGNAISYNEYNKYISPKQNMFYKQYI